MEDRLTPVVGAYGGATVLASNQFDGVVQVSAFDDNGTTWNGSGVLLSTGRHILTAAHVLTDNRGRLHANNTVVTFRTGHFTSDNFVEQMTIPVAGHFVHPNWNGESDRDYGYDLAILELPQFAPALADRFDIYRGSDEVGKMITMVGYGMTGTGTRGATAPADGNRRMATNVIDATSSDHWYLRGRGGPNGTVLEIDFDERDGEGIPAPGDSGGPFFLGNRVAGIISAGFETALFGGAPESNFGEIATATRVSFFANWIDGIVNQRRNLVFDANTQRQGSDGSTDQMTIRSSGANIELVYNAQLIGRLPKSSITNLTIRGSNDADFIRLEGDVLDQAFPLGVNALGGNDTIQAPNTWNRWNITGPNSGSLNNLRFTGVENLRGGTSGDSFYFSPSGSLTGQLRGGHGSMPDTIDYSAWTTGVTVNLTTGMATAVAGGVFELENAWGGEGNDILIGNSVNNVLVGNGGHDYLEGREGEDWLFGGAGNDILDGGRDGIRDHLFGGAGQDTFVEHYNPIVLTGGLIYWHLEADETDYDPMADVKAIRRHW